MDSDPHCTAVNREGSTYSGHAECTCGWRSPSTFFGDAEQLATWHRLAVGETIDNPYLRAFLSPITSAELQTLGMLRSELLSDCLAGRARRDRLTAQYAWAIPTEIVIRKLAELSPICELGCGTGYWAKLLGEVGARMIAVEPRPPLSGDNHWHRNNAGLSKQLVEIRHFVELTRGNAQTFDVPQDHALMLCWPPYNDDTAAVALDRYRGQTVIYIGEHGGCTGDDVFHEALDAKWALEARYEIPQWEGLHDAVFVYRRPAYE
jgi:SAM-dependent methyltransferase